MGQRVAIARDLTFRLSRRGGARYKFPDDPSGEEVNRLKRILILMIGLALSLVPVTGGLMTAGGPVPLDDDCDDEDDDAIDTPGTRSGDDGDDDDDDDDDDCDDEDDDGGAAGTRWLISESAILNGLDALALFPFIDVTPNSIARAHIAITDGTETCSAGASAPQNIQVLVGVAGGSLVNVMTDATNTGIGDVNQCVFHVTVVPGVDGVPAQITDIVIVNGGEAPLTGRNTVTATAEVVP